MDAMNVEGVTSKQEVLSFDLRTALQRLEGGILLAREGKDTTQRAEGLAVAKKALESIKIMKETSDEAEVYREVIPYDSDLEKLERELKDAENAFVSNTFGSVPEDPEDLGKN